LIPIASLTCRNRLPMCFTSKDQMCLVIRLDASAIFVDHVVVGIQMVSDFSKDTTCSIIIYKTMEADSVVIMKQS